MLAPWILGHFPVHSGYVEAYGGAGSVLLRKPRVKHEIYNDLDGEVVNLFRVLQSPTNGPRLRELLEVTPFARAEFELAYEPAQDRVERARRLVVRCFMGFGSDANNPEQRTGFRAKSSRQGRGAAGDWENYPKALEAIIARLSGVIIENRPAVEVLVQQDEPTILHYVDPPYVHDVRTNYTNGRKGYAFEMTDQDHRDLAGVLKGLKGFVVLSGYDCPLYRELYGDWFKIDRNALADGARARVESLWMNRQAWDARPQGSLI